MNVDLITAALWFGFGAFSYKMVALLMDYGRNVMLVQRTVLGLLLMLKYYDKVFQGEKQKIVEKIKEDSPELTASHKLLDLTLDVWRLQSVRAIKNYLPPKLQSIATFKSWDEAMKFIDKIEKGL